MINGEFIVVRGVMKLIFMFYKLLMLVDIDIYEFYRVIVECFDFMVFLVVGVVMEVVVVIVLVIEVLEKFFLDNMYELKEVVKLYCNYVNYF